MSRQSKMKKLASDIRDFLDEYAKIRPGSSPDDEIPEYTSPDAFALLGAARSLENGEVPGSVWSDWSSGGYKRSERGKERHKSILSRIRDLR